MSFAGWKNKLDRNVVAPLLLKLAQLRAVHAAVNELQDEVVCTVIKGDGSALTIARNGNKITITEAPPDDVTLEVKDGKLAIKGYEDASEGHFPQKTSSGFEWDWPRFYYSS